MALSAQDRVRQSVVHKVAPDVILARYRAMKGLATARLEDIPPAVMAVLVGDVLAFLSPENLRHSVQACNRVQAHSFAVQDDEAESIAAQARRDIEHYGGTRSHFAFNGVAPGHCFVYRLRVGAINGATLHLTEDLIADVHTECAMKDERCIPVSKVSFILKGGL